MKKLFSQVTFYLAIPFLILAVLSIVVSCFRTPQNRTVTTLEKAVNKRDVKMLKSLIPPEEETDSILDDETAEELMEAVLGSNDEKKIKVIQGSEYVDEDGKKHVPTTVLYLKGGKVDSYLTDEIELIEVNGKEYLYE